MPDSKLTKLVRAAGGEVDASGFVTRPGVMLLSETRLAPAAQDLFDALHIDALRPEFEQLAEFNARITYLSFRDEAGESSRAFNEKMVHEYGHMSVHSAWSATLLVAGISIECVLELVAHSEAKVSRLTSSRTKSQDAPLHVMPADASHRDAIDATAAAVAAIPLPATLDAREARNKLWPGYKASALTYTMTLKDFHKLFIGRLSPHGVEEEVRDICERMCALLHSRFPLVIRAPEAYYAIGNSAKYES